MCQVEPYGVTIWCHKLPPGARIHIHAVREERIPGPRKRKRPATDTDDEAHPLGKTPRPENLTGGPSCARCCCQARPRCVIIRPGVAMTLTASRRNAPALPGTNLRSRSSAMKNEKHIGARPNGAAKVAELVKFTFHGDELD